MYQKKKIKRECKKGVDFMLFVLCFRIYFISFENYSKVLRKEYK